MANAVYVVICRHQQWCIDLNLDRVVHHLRDGYPSREEATIAAIRLANTAGAGGEFASVIVKTDDSYARVWTYPTSAQQEAG